MNKTLRFLVAIAALAFAACSSASAQELIKPIPPGIEGTVTQEQLESAPMPWWSPLYPNPGKDVNVADYKNFEMVVISYATDADKAAALVPKGLHIVDIPSLPGQAPVSITWAKYPHVSTIGPYLEVIVSIPVVVDKLPYLYVAAIYVDSDSGMAAGREIGGYPKKIAHIEANNYGDLFLDSISRHDKTKKTAAPEFSVLASASVRKGGRLVSVPLPAENIKPLPFPYSDILPLPKANGEPQKLTLLTMGQKMIPGVGDKADKPEVLQLVATPWVMYEGEIYEGLDASLDLINQPEDPIAKALPVNAVLGSYIIRGSMTTRVDQWFVVKDYLK
jgi:hypothetical protein